MIPIFQKYREQIPEGSWILATRYNAGTDAPVDIEVFLEVLDDISSEKYNEGYFGAGRWAKILKVTEAQKKWGEKIPLRSFDKFFLLNDKERKAIERKVLVNSI